MTKDKIASSLLVVIAIVALVSIVGVAASEEVEAQARKLLCSGSHSFSSFNNLIVPEGQTCKLDRFNVVNGDIEVRKGATLIICPDNQILGDVKARNADTVFISDQPIPPCREIKERGVTIGGDVKV